MPRPRSWTDIRAALADDRGSAPLEFIFVGLLLLVPVVYLIVALGLIQEQSLGAESGARHIARAVATAEGTASADARARVVLDTVVAEYGLDEERVDVAVTCRDAVATCPAAGATVVVTVRTEVALPLVPPVLGLERIARVPLEASVAQKVSRFWRNG